MVDDKRCSKARFTKDRDFGWLFCFVFILGLEVTLQV